MLLDRAVSQWDSLAKNTAARVKKSHSFRSVSLSRRNGPARPARPALPGVCGPGIRPVAARPAGGRANYLQSPIPRDLGDRPTRFPCEPNGLGLDRIGKLTSYRCCHADLQFHDSPTYGGVCEIRGRSPNSVSLKPAAAHIARTSHRRRNHRKTPTRHGRLQPIKFTLASKALDS